MSPRHLLIGFFGSERSSYFADSRIRIDPFPANKLNYLLTYLFIIKSYTRCKNKQQYAEIQNDDTRVKKEKEKIPCYSSFQLRLLRVKFRRVSKSQCMVTLNFD